MSINWQPPKFKAGDKVVICDWNEVIKAIEDDEETNWSSVKRRLECARLYGGKSAIVVDWGPDVYGKEGQTDIVNIYRLADESGNIIPFAFMDSMFAWWEPNDTKEVTKSADGATEEKFTLFPQLQKDDIVRYISRLSGEESIDVATYEHLDDYFYFIGEVLAIYRFDGRDFKCIWESKEYKLDRFEEIIDEINKIQLTLSVKLKSVSEAMKKLEKEAKGT